MCVCVCVCACACVRDTQSSSHCCLDHQQTMYI